jgi:hypothetical protein
LQKLPPTVRVVVRCTTDAAPTPVGENVTSVADFLADQAQRPGVPLDGHNRYKLPHPETGKVQAWTRVTTWARTPSDTYGLTVYQLRMAARGLAVRPDLVLRLLADYGDNKVVDEAIAQAQEHAGSTTAATTGSAYHRFTELVDSGEPLPPLPPSTQRDITAYEATLRAAKLSVLHVERIVCVPDLGVAGTLDRVLTHGQHAWIADLKTGADLGPSWGEIATQLACYAHGAALWNPDTESWDEMPDVDQQIAIVIWLPIGRSECTLHAVDIAAGWDAAVQLCGPVRQWRNRGRDLVSPFAPPAGVTPPRAPATPPGPATEATPTADVDRAGWITGRLKGLAGDVRARNLVAQRWPDGVEVRGPWTDEQIDALAAMLEDVEREVGAQFTGSDPARHLHSVPEHEPEPSPVPPWDITDDGVVADDGDVKALAATLATRPVEAQRTVKRWAGQARKYSRAFDGPGMTQRMWSCARAAIACATHIGDDDRTRRALSLAIYDPEQSDGEDPPEPLPDSWATGVVIGSLDAAQAEWLADEATANDTTHRYDPV